MPDSMHIVVTGFHISLRGHILTSDTVPRFHVVDFQKIFPAGGAFASGALGIKLIDLFGCIYSILSSRICMVRARQQEDSLLPNLEKPYMIDRLLLP